MTRVCKAGNQRHWFTRRGSVGEASPVCVRCGVPNPKATDSYCGCRHHKLDHDEKGCTVTLCRCRAFAPRL